MPMTLTPRAVVNPAAFVTNGDRNLPPEVSCGGGAGKSQVK